MKALLYISLPMILIFGSCASTLYTGAENDDLYYSSSDRPVVKESAVVNNPVAEKELKANNYYDNVYSADTLITDKYSLPSDYDDQIVINNNNLGTSGSGYDYYDDSYSNRINMFYGNYFYPYWQDPFYFSYGYPYYGMGFGFNYGFGLGLGFGYGFGYSPFYYGYNPYLWDSYYLYGGYYGGYYGYPYYGGRYFLNDSRYTSYGRRERSSNMSSRWNDNLGMAGSSRRNGTYAASGGRSYSGATSTLSPDSRRSAALSSSGTTARRLTQDPAARTRSASSTSKSQITEKPDYRSANRSYTPSYSSPRMSTRPSYNNSRVYEPAAGAGRSSRVLNENRSYGNTSRVINSARPANQGSVSGGRTNSFSNMQRRYSAPASSSKQYSAPSRRSTESFRSSSGSSGRSSFSGGSSGSYSRSSSSGSFSGSSGHSSSSSSRSSGGRR